MEEEQVKPKESDYFCRDCQLTCETKEGHEEHEIKRREEAQRDIKQELACTQRDIKQELARTERNLRSLSILDEEDAKNSHDDIECLMQSFRKMEIRPIPTSGKTIKVASWNLNNFSSTKIEDGQKIDLICSIIIKENFDVIALQEVGEKKDIGIDSEESALQILYDKLQEKSDKWMMCHTEAFIGRVYRGSAYGVFIWNSSSGLDMTSATTPLNPKVKFSRKPVVGNFEVGDWKFSLISFHLKARGGKKGNKGNNKEVKNLHLVLDTDEVKGRDVILLGDFNTFVVADADRDELGKRKYSNMFATDEFTNTNDDSCYDGIIIHSDVKRDRYERHGVADIDETEDFQASEVSDHRPIWAEFKY